MSAWSYTYSDHVRDHGQRLERARTERLARSLRRSSTFRVGFVRKAGAASLDGRSVPANVAVSR